MSGQGFGRLAGVLSHGKVQSPGDTTRKTAGNTIRTHVKLTKIWIW